MLALALASVVEQAMGGSSGAVSKINAIIEDYKILLQTLLRATVYYLQLYSLFLSAASGALQKDVSATGYQKALKAGMDAIQRYGGAEPGDRTMVSSNGYTITRADADDTSYTRTAMLNQISVVQSKNFALCSFLSVGCTLPMSPDAPS